MTSQTSRHRSSVTLLAGRYTVDTSAEARLGAGGMGEVFRGRDEQTGLDIAVKVLKEELAFANPSALERFIREGEALRRLRHGNIVQVLDAIESEGRQYLLMELVSGGSLRGQLERHGPLPLHQAVSICMELCDALARVHHIDILHRDIKPDNVLLAEDGSPRLTDFGVARFGSATRITEVDCIVGTLDYMSPEALNGVPPDAASDLWAFGVMLFELLTGLRPFTAATPGATVGAILGQALPDLAALRPETPPRLIALIERLLARDRSARLVSARQLGAELESILDELPTIKGPSPSHDTTPAPLAGIALATTLPQRAAPRGQTEAPAEREPVSVPPERRNHHIILDKVRRFWVDGVLRPAAAEQAPIVLKYERCNDIVAHPWDGINTGKGKAGGEALDVLSEYESSERALLIVGEPGGGKTYSMLTLCERLIERAERDPWAPIPVVFNLSSWLSRRAPLGDWLVEELVSKYQLPRAMGREWLAKNEIVLFLDDLDGAQKAHPTACIEAINRFREDHGLMGIIVCARRSDYLAAGVALRLGGAIAVREIDEKQLEKALAGASSGKLRAALAEDAGLRQLARVPLLLRVLMEVQEKLDSDEQSLSEVTKRPSGVPTTGTHRRRLLATYVDRMLVTRGRYGDFSATETKRYLGNLARKMNEHNTRMFLVEDLQPSWLGSPGQRLAYLAISRLFAGVCYGVVNATTTLVIIGPLGKKALPVVHLLIERAGFSGRGAAYLVWMLLGLLVGTMIALTDALLLFRREGSAPPRPWASRWDFRMAAIHVFISSATITALCIPFGITMESFFGSIIVSLALLPLTQPRRDPSFKNEIRPVEALGWSWKPALVGALAGLPVSALGLVVNSADKGSSIRLKIWIAIAFPVIFFLVGGLQSKRLEATNRPNGGILLSLRNGVYAFILVSGVIITIALCVIGFAPELILTLPNAMTIPLFFGWLSVCRHLLLRRFLASTGVLPWRLVPLLDHAVNAALMRRVGGGYMFVHALLQDHLAEAAPEAGGLSRQEDHHITGLAPPRGSS